MHYSTRSTGPNHHPSNKSHGNNHDQVDSSNRCCVRPASLLNGLRHRLPAIAPNAFDSDKSERQLVTAGNFTVRDLSLTEPPGRMALRPGCRYTSLVSPRCPEYRSGTFVWVYMYGCAFKLVILVYSDQPARTPTAESQWHWHHTAAGDLDAGPGPCHRMWAVTMART